MSEGQTVDATIRLQALDGTWETCGADRAIGVDPESLTYSHNEWGPDKANFNLHRSPIAIWPDIGAFTPVEIEVGGVIVWEGRTNETPLRLGSEQVINVQCQGWQYQLDDDVYQRAYVHSKLTDWKDCRSFLGENLAALTTAGTVTSQQGAIVIGWANGSVIPANGQVGVKLDLGPQNSAAAIGIEVKGVTGAANSGGYLYVEAHSDQTAGSENRPWALVPLATIGTNADVYEGNFPAAGARYITVSLWVPSEVTLNGDVTLQVRSATVVTDTSFIAGGTTIATLRAFQVVLDALERATLLLSPDYSQIESTAFYIPDFTLSKASTPREAIEAANAYHNWIAKLLTGRRFQFRERPTDPLLEIGAWSGADLEDTSANAGAEIYNRALIEATGADGSPLDVERAASQQPGVMPVAISSPSPDNPSFTTNAASWSALTGSITRDTGNYHSEPAGGRWNTGTGDALTETFSGTFQKGAIYALTFWLHSGPVLTATFGVAADNVSARNTEGVWAPLTLVWTPLATCTGVTLVLKAVSGSSGYVLYVDDLTLTVTAPTLVDRRGFRRTKVIQMSSAITPVEGNQLADIFLQAHMTTPFKGSATVTPGGVRTVLGGQPVHPSQLGLHTQELLRLSHLTDPDTGGIGRDGTIAECTYTHKDQKAAVVLDNKRANFDALLSRLAVVQSVGS